MAVDYFIKIGEVKGESKDKAYADWIDVLSWSWGVSQTGSFGYGGGGGTGKVNVQELKFKKRADTATPDLLLHCSAGEHYPEATLIARAAGGRTGQAMEYMKMVLTDVIITSVQHEGSASSSREQAGTARSREADDERPTETVSLNFSKYQTTYTGQEQSGGKGTSSEIKWDVTGNAEF